MVCMTWLSDEPEAMQQSALNRLPAAPYRFSVVDGSGHMRKLDDMESEIIRMAISRYGGHLSEVARRLGISRSTLYRKLKKSVLEQSGEELPTEAKGNSATAAE